MAIKLIESKFTDIYGNVTNQFKANAGDSITVSHTYETEISFVSTTENQIRIDKLENKLTKSSGSFLEDGFRVGQNYQLYIVNNNNNTHELFSGSITSVTERVITCTGLPSRNNWSSGTDYICVFLSTSSYNALDFTFNFIDNTATEVNFDSLIDGETSRFTIEYLNLFTVNDIDALVQVGKKSGQFSIINPTIKRLSDTVNPYTAFNSTRKKYKVEFTLIMPSMFSEDSFIGSECLKYCSKASFKVLANENLSPTVLTYNNEANTGLWNEGFNSEQPQGKTGTLINEIFYNKTNTLSFQVTCNTSLNISQIELGAMYYTLDDDYNKNKEEAQDYLLPFIKTGLIGVADIGNDWISNVKPFNIMLDGLSFVDAGGIRTFTINITLNPFYNNPNAFGAFVDARGELDRKFYLWCKIGNTNRLIYGSELQFEMPVGIPFTPDEDAIVNHDNIIDFTDISNQAIIDNVDFNIEDDVLFIADFPINNTDENESINAKIVVRNDMLDYEFDLERISFDLTTQDLQYFTNQSLPLNNNLPVSNKTTAYLLSMGYDSGTLNLRLIYPFLFNWRYWEDIYQSHPIFSSQNKDNNNWFNYFITNWTIRIKIEIVRNGVADYYYRNITFKNYDDWLGTSTVELYDLTESKKLSRLPENDLARIKATHVFPSDYTGFPWGMITIEPKENSPRYIISTEVDRSQNENPLIGITDVDRCDIEFYDTKTIILRCIVNTNLLNGNEFCISSKISEEGTLNPPKSTNKITEDSIDKITEAIELKFTE